MRDHSWSIPAPVRYRSRSHILSAIDGRYRPERHIWTRPHINWSYICGRDISVRRHRTNVCRSSHADAHHNTGVSLGNGGSG
jgi:hypothetical protein